MLGIVTNKHISRISSVAVLVIELPISHIQLQVFATTMPRIRNLTALVVRRQRSKILYLYKLVLIIVFVVVLAIVLLVLQLLWNLLKHVMNIDLPSLISNFWSSSIALKCCLWRGIYCIPTIHTTLEMLIRPSPFSSNSTVINWPQSSSAHPQQSLWQWRQSALALPIKLDISQMTGIIEWAMCIPKMPILFTNSPSPLWKLHIHQLLTANDRMWYMYQ